MGLWEYGIGVWVIRKKEVRIWIHLVCDFLVGGWRIGD